MKKRNLISVILVVALLLSCSLSVLAAVPPKGETAEPQMAKVRCERCDAEATVLNSPYDVVKTIWVSSGACPIERGTSHTHDEYYRGVRINCPNCGIIVVGLKYLRFVCSAVA